MLKCERNTKTMESMVLAAARKYFGHRKGISAAFEHGQWYIFRDNGEETENYSVCDAEGYGTVNGFSFDRI